MVHYLKRGRKKRGGKLWYHMQTFFKWFSEIIMIGSIGIVFCDYCVFLWDKANDKQINLLFLSMRIRILHVVERIKFNIK